MAADLDIDQASGTAGNMIHVLGYNYNGGSPTVDGTRPIIDADSAADHCILVDNRWRWRWENVEFRNSNTAANVAVTNTSAVFYWVFINCISRNAATQGWGRGNGSGEGFRDTFYILCQALGNGTDGYDIDESNNIYCLSTAIGNGGFGMGGISPVVIGCVSHQNTVTGIRVRWGAVVWNSVIDTNNDGFSPYNATLVAGCRITNNTGSAYDESGASTIYSLWNYLDNNGAADTVTELIESVRGSPTNLTVGEQGYRDRANDLFELVMGAAGFRTELDIDGSMSAYFNRGLPNVPLVGPRG